MKRLSLIDLHKAEIRKNVMANIKGGIEYKCFCSVDHPYVTLRETAPSSNACLCTSLDSNSVSVQHKK